MVQYYVADNKSRTSWIKGFVTVQLINAGESLCCYAEDFYLSLQLLTVNT